MTALRNILLAIATAHSAGCYSVSGHTPHPAAQTLADATQLVVVTTAGWDSTTGKLHRFVRDDTRAPWRRDGDAVPIVVGRHGMAWGVGFDSLADTDRPTTGPRKREGDGRSPAGVFPLRMAFGFAPADSVAWIRLPYKQLTSTIECVDDTLSVYYNAVIDRAAISKIDWQSAEHMRRIFQYRLGVFVDYNITPSLQGRGSCIFLHIWGGPQTPTSGCTAMASSDLEHVLAWLDPHTHPVIVQAPVDMYSHLSAAWKLPALGG